MKYSRFAALVVLATFAAAFAAGAATQVDPNPSAFFVARGSVHIASFAARMIGVTVVPEGATGNVHGFSIAFESAPRPIDVRLASASIEFRPTELIVMSTGDDRTFYRFTVGPAAVALTPPDGFTHVEYCSIGMSHKIAVRSRSVTPSLYVDPVENLVDDFDASGGGTTCTAGGVGATQCSIGATAAGSGLNCSVTCTGAYYACCGPNSCRCIHY